MSERWALLTQFDSAYEISDMGVLRSVERKDAAGAMRQSQIMKCAIHKKYYRTGVRFNKEQKTVCIHILVATMFVSNPNNYPLVNHLDGNTFNNAYWNLEWTNHIGNTIHAIENRLTRKKNGELTLTSQQVLEIFNSDQNASFLSKKYNVCKLTIHQIRNGVKWGFITGKKYEPKNGSRKYVYYNGEKLTCGELAKKLKVSRGTISYRINQGKYLCI